jgi:hypothetical protein
LRWRRRLRIDRRRLSARWRRKRERNRDYDRERNRAARPNLSNPALSLASSHGFSEDAAAPRTVRAEAA